MCHYPQLNVPFLNDSAHLAQPPYAEAENEIKLSFSVCLYGCTDPDLSASWFFFWLQFQLVYKFSFVTVSICPFTQLEEWIQHTASLS